MNAGGRGGQRNAPTKNAVATMPQQRFVVPPTNTHETAVTLRPTGIVLVQGLSYRIKVQRDLFELGADPKRNLRSDSFGVCAIRPVAFNFSTKLNASKELTFFIHRCLCSLLLGPFFDWSTIA